MIQRKSVRALLLDEVRQSVLLIHARVPDTGVELWLMPGGGMESGETPEQTLIREVAEETGYSIDPKQEPSPIWWRRHQFVFLGKEYDQQDEIYLVPASEFVPTTRFNPEQQEVDSFIAFRWWTLAEIQASKEMFVPGALGLHLKNLLTVGVPRQTINVGR